MRLVECVPNFSEGRRPEVVDAICAAIAGVPGVSVLGREMDADHNRAVVTFVGPIEAAQEAAFRAIREAAQRIDLRNHQGAHPRMGATDVCPFVPLGDTTMEEAALAALSLAARVGRALAIPVSLYAEAATRPERRDLSAIRKGEFEGIRVEMGRDPARAPDFGPERIHESAGCTAIGARFFLIAYNVNLATNDVPLAKRIAKEIRERDGGLPAVKAMGFHLADRDVAQVSINLTDFRRTSPGRVFDEVRTRAEAAGARVLESELVGLIPQAAVTQSFVDLTRPAGWTGEEVIESRLPPPDPMDACESFLDVLASDNPTPGGGSAAALAGAAAASLVVMVCSLTIGREKFREVDEELRGVRTQGLELKKSLQQLVRRDSEAYASYMAAMKLPKETPEQKAARKAAMAAAAIHAAEIPLETMELALDVMGLAVRVAQKGNPNPARDGAGGARLARAAVRAADMNVRINLPSIQDEAVRGRMAAEADQMVRRTEDLERAAIAATGLT